MSRRFGFLIALAITAWMCGPARANPVGAFAMQGKTQSFTAATSSPTPVQVNGDGNTAPGQYVVTNTGSVAAFVACESTSAAATAATASVPTSSPLRSYTLLPSTQVTLSCAPGAFFTGVTSSSTAVVTVTPGEGM